MHSPGAWVHVPQKVEVSLSVDGKTFTPAGTAWCDIPDDVPKLLLKEYGTVCQGEARYVRVHAVKNPRPGAWLFTDEIVKPVYSWLVFRTHGPCVPTFAIV